MPRQRQVVLRECTTSAKWRQWAGCRESYASSPSRGRPAKGSSNFFEGKTDNKSEAITSVRIIGETDSSNKDTSSRVVVSDRRFTLPEITRAARRWLAPEPLEKLLQELKGEEENEPKLAPARATDRERNQAYQKLRSLGKLDQ